MEMDNMEYIDDYFNSSPNEQQRQKFEERVINDVSFAQQVSFYISANSAARELLLQQKKDRFKELYLQQKVVAITRKPIKQIWRYAAAACIVAIVSLAGVLFFNNNTNPQQFADKYATEHFYNYSGTMGNMQDSIQVGLSLLKNEKASLAQTYFKNILKKDPANSDAKKYAGIASFKLKEYDKALYYFHALEANDIMFNPAKMYQAVVLLKRNKTGDNSAAKKLFEDIKNNNLEGKEDATEWLQKLQ